MAKAKTVATKTTKTEAAKATPKAPPKVEPKPKRRRRKSVDPEVQAMAVCLQALGGLSAAERTRVMDYVAKRLAEVDAEKNQDS